MSEPLLSVRGIHTYYGDSYVLQGLDLELSPGTIVVILGRNGMGKTTLIRSVAGLTPPRRGEIISRDARSRPAGVRDRAGRHGDRAAGAAHLPLADRAREPAAADQRARRPARRRAAGRQRWDLAGVLAEFPQLAERIGHLGGALSGGEQQMLAIGRALMANPDLILMDEPSEGLAPRLVQQAGRS